MKLEIEKNTYEDSSERYFISEYHKDDDGDYFFVRTYHRTATTLEEARKQLENLKKTIISNRIIKSEIIHEEEF